MQNVLYVFLQVFVHASSFVFESLNSYSSDSVRELQLIQIEVHLLFCI